MNQKTPGEDFALEERKGRWRELPCPLTIKLFPAARLLASPGCMNGSAGQFADISAGLPTTDLQSGKESRKSLPCQFSGRSKTSAFLPTFDKTGKTVFALISFLMRRVMWQSLHGKKTSTTLKGYDLERDLLNFSTTGFFPIFMGSSF